MCGKGTSGIERQRRQRGEDRLLEIRICGGALLFRQIGVVQDVNSRTLQRRHQFLAPAIMGITKQADDRSANGAQLLRRRHPVGTGFGDTLLDLPLQPGHAHHKELVDVRSYERQEHQPIEQRVVAVLRLFQHAPLKVQQTELAVDEQRRIVEPSSLLGFVVVARFDRWGYTGRRTSSLGWVQV